VAGRAVGESDARAAARRSLLRCPTAAAAAAAASAAAVAGWVAVPHGDGVETAVERGCCGGCAARLCAIRAEVGCAGVKDGRDSGGETARTAGPGGGRGGGDRGA